MSEPKDEDGTHFLSLELPSLAIKVVADLRGEPDISIGKENLNTFLLTAIDILAIQPGRDYPGLLVLRRWARYAKAAIKDLEEISPFPSGDEPLGKV